MSRSTLKRVADHLAASDADVPVATAADILLLKLYACVGTQIEDAALILGGRDADEILAAASAEVVHLPTECQERWAGFLSRRS